VFCPFSLSLSVVVEGFEPSTLGLCVEYSTTALPGRRIS
jgi:hypothetical protein